MIRRLLDVFSKHSWEHYGTEGPYDDGHYWKYYRCRRCRETRISPKMTVAKHGEPDQPQDSH